MQAWGRSIIRVFPVLLLVLMLSSTITCLSQSYDYWFMLLGTPDYEVSRGVTVSPDGSVIIVGTITYSRGTTGGFIAKLDANGNVIWSKTLSASGFGYDVLPVTLLENVVCDPNGNIYVVGECGDNRVVSAALILKLYANGSIAWSKAYGGKYSWGFYDVVLGRDGNIVVVGKCPEKFSSTYYYSDYLVAKLDPKGNLMFAVSFGIPDGSDIATCVTVDENNSIYVAGISQSGEEIDTILAKFNETGSPIKARIIGDRGYFEYPFSIIVDESSVYVCGGSLYYNSYSDKNLTGILIKMDRDLSISSDDIMIKCGEGEASFYSISLDIENKVLYTAGYTYAGESGGSDAFIAAFDANTLNPSRAWSIGTSMDEFLLEGTLSYRLNKTFLAGYVNAGGRMGEEALLIKFDPSIPSKLVWVNESSWESVKVATISLNTSIWDPVTNVFLTDNNITSILNSTLVSSLTEPELSITMDPWSPEILLAVPYLPYIVGESKGTGVFGGEASCVRTLVLQAVLSLAVILFLAVARKRK